jgi:hypothetical protein
MNEFMQTILGCEALRVQIIFMFINPSNNVVRDADVHCGSVIGHDVYGKVFVHDVKRENQKPNYDSGQAGMTALGHETLIDYQSFSSSSAPDRAPF